MRNKRLITGLGLIAVCSILFTVSSSLMWFDNKTTITPDEVTGSSDGAYYASGSGTKDDPYIINQPRHLYNLAWLQYLGAYNKDTGTDGIDEVYFKVEGTTNSAGDSVLDMDGWVLPPIGTEENPFVGNFNGNNTIIKNLTVSNTFSDYEDNHPYYNANNEVMSESTFTQPKIIGFFGVIGALDSQTYEYSNNIAVKDAAYTDANLVYDTYVDNITIENNTENQELLAGLLAGYVNAPIIQSGVGYGEFDFASGTTNLSSSNTPSGATINGVSNYSLIGAYNPKSFDYTGLPTTDSGSDDEGNDWGGSINIYEFSKRWTYILNKNQTYSSIMISGSNADMGLKGIKFTYKTNKVLYEMVDNSITLYNSSYFPINVDTDKEFENEIRSTFTNNSKTITYAITDYFSDSKNTKEAVIETNSGYLTTTSSENQTYHYIWKNQKVGASLGFTKSGSSYTSSSFNEDNLVMLNIDSSGNLSRIVDGNNTTNNTNLNSTYSNTIDASSLTQYSKVKTHIKEFLSNDNNYIYSLAWNSSSTPSTIDGTFKLNGNTYSKVYAPGVDFYVSKKGYITAVFCSNANGTGNKLFSLYKVTRSSDGTPSIEQVKNVIPTSTSTFASASALLYIQIPVESGEYFIGPDVDSSASTSAGFMYLDIGANAGDSGSGDTPSTTSPTEIDFVYYDSTTKKLVKITSEKDSDGNYIYKNSEVVFQIGSSGSTLSGTYSFNRTTSLAVLYYQASEVITVIGTGTATSSGKDGVKKNS